MEVPIDLAQPRFMKRKESITLPSLFDESDSSHERLKTVLETPPALRSDAQVNALVAFSRHMKFFSELRDTISEIAHFQCCRRMTYAHYHSGKVPSTQLVFHEGDEGSQFFLILSGSCAVLSLQGPEKVKRRLSLLAILRQGECFGELALISRMPRAASVLCREECNFAVLERDDYREILGNIQDRQLYEKIELLRQHPVLSGWKRESVQRLSYFFKSRTVKRKQTLFIAGQTATEVFLIQDGEFHISKSMVSYAAGKQRNRPIRREIDVGTVRSGELLGAAQAIEDTHNEYTCYCASQSGEVLVISKQNFKNVLMNEGVTSILHAFEREKNRYREKQTTAILLVKEMRETVPIISEKGYQSLVAKAGGPKLPRPRFQTPTRMANPTRKKSLADLEQRGPTLSPSAEFGEVGAKEALQRRSPSSLYNQCSLHRSQQDLEMSRTASLPLLSLSFVERSGESWKLRHDGEARNV